MDAHKAIHVPLQTESSLTITPALLHLKAQLRESSVGTLALSLRQTQVSILSAQRMNRDVPARAHNSTVQQRWDAPSSAPMANNNAVPNIASPDSRNVSDDRIPPQRTHSRHADFETTADGDVVIVQPSFDEGRGTPSSVSHKQGSWSSSPHVDVRMQSDPLKEPVVKRHTRNLSAHFFDATCLSRKDSDDPADTFNEESNDTRKHRRMTSGGVSNPNTAHRRLNSIGTSAPVARSNHRRDHSAGLDMLSAAANATSEELEQAAGRKEAQWGGRPESSAKPTPTPSASAITHHGPSLQHGYRSFPPPGHTMPPPPPHQMRRYSGPGPAPYYPPPHTYGPPAHEYPCYYPSYQHQPRSDYPPPEHYSSQPMYQHHNKMYPPETRNVAVGTDPTDNRAAWDSAQRATQGSQTFVTTMGAGGNRTTARPSTTTDVPSHVTQHHRRMSSFSSLGLGTIFGGQQGSPERAHPLKKKDNEARASHHRSTSSSVSFLNALDVAGMSGAMDETFIRSLNEPSTATERTQASTATPPALMCIPVAPEVPSASIVTDDTTKKLAPGLATSKRVRRKCTISGCPNRVVQGGLCISHGAKRKTCKYAGCNKNVKKAGLCSTHGPARKRCDVPECQKVAVQGGRCIAHGAKKKMCAVDSCTKQAILGGMCKKHHDQSLESKQGKQKSKGHQRGLSIFAEISADAVQAIVNADAISESSPESGARASW